MLKLPTKYIFLNNEAFITQKGERVAAVYDVSIKEDQKYLDVTVGFFLLLSQLPWLVLIFTSGSKRKSCPTKVHGCVLKEAGRRK